MLPADVSVTADECAAVEESVVWMLAVVDEEANREAVVSGGEVVSVSVV